MAEALQQKLQAASEAIETQPANAVAQLRDILLGSYPNDAEALKVKESALDMLAAALVKQKDTAGLRKLLTDLRPWFGVIPKAKTAKLVRTVIESIGKVPDSTQVLVSFLILVVLSSVYFPRRRLSFSNQSSSSIYNS
jgi:26S proteasome regulatory subunit N6